MHQFLLTFLNSTECFCTLFDLFLRDENGIEFRKSIIPDIGLFKLKKKFQSPKWPKMVLKFKKKFKIWMSVFRRKFHWVFVFFPYLVHFSSVFYFFHERINFIIFPYFDSFIENVFVFLISVIFFYSFQKKIRS